MPLECPLPAISRHLINNVLSPLTTGLERIRDIQCRSVKNLFNGDFRPIADAGKSIDIMQSFI